MSHPTSKTLWRWCLAVFAAGALAYFLLPAGAAAKPFVYIACDVLTVAVVTWAVSQVPARERPIWALLACGSALSLVGNVLWYLVPAMTHRPASFPSTADAVFLASYAVIGAAVLCIALRRGGERTLASALDAGIITVGLAALSYIVLMKPILHQSGDSGLATVTAMAYPATDLLLFGLVTWLGGVGGLRAPAIRLLIAFVAAQLIGDSVYADASAAGTFQFGDVCFLGWFVAYGCLAAAALHPSRVALTSPATRALPTLHPGIRLAAVGSASMLTPALLLITQVAEDNERDQAVLIVLSMAMFLLVVVRMAVMLRELLRSESAVRHQALHDALTGLPNRALLLDRTQQALQRSVRSGVPVSLLVIDLDGFKAVNDGLGHEVGDAMLRHAAAVLKACLRPADTAARWGGDEFTVLLDDADSQVAGAVAARMLAALRQPAPIKGRELLTQASIGIATSPGGAVELDELFRDADIAMYGAKARGKGCVEHFQPYMHTEVIRALELQVGLERAIQNDELEVHYQPLVKLSSGALVGVEALVRWRHPERGLVPPDEFIGLAEQSGVIVPLGQTVLRKACADLARWRRTIPGAAALTLSVNLSGRQLMSPELTSQILETLAAAGLEPSRLVVEITERVLVDGSGAALDTIHALRAEGIAVAIDDFGTGYSSLGYLRNLPADVVKIDRAFIAHMSSESDRAFVESVVAMIKTLGLASVAEGVETREQADAMLDMGCDEAQGFYFARPLDAVAMGGFLAASAMAALVPAGRRAG